MSSESRVLVFHDLEARPSGEYADSPRHITLLPPTKIPDRKIDGLAESLQIVANETKPFEVLRGKRDYFGAEHDIPVDRVVDPEKRLRALHSDVLQVAWLHEFLSDVDQTYIGLRYNPHYSLKDGIEFPDIHTINHISLYRRAGNSALRSIWRFDFPTVEN